VALAAPGVALAAATTDTFDTPPVLSAVAAPLTWYPDRKAPAAYDSVTFDGDKRLHIGINGADWDSGNNFYNTQGRKRDTGSGDGQSIQADLYIAPDWATGQRRSDLWATAVDSGGASSGFPVLGFLSGTGFRAFTQSGWQVIGYPTGFSYGRWYRLRIDITPTEFRYYIDGNLVATDSQLNGTVGYSNMMLQAYNFGSSYDVYWDNASPGNPTVVAPPVVSTPASSTWTLALTAGLGIVLVGVAARRRRAARR
jgi:hypothetical protein